ncbi:MAG: class I SAM-dependent methyltransferase [Candidatus Polarisedimenticolaceae bacterium]|nr:class I SAM-dependent methyltransferase [Candidatus Polarisedimenticolaceae bacterium]
MDEQTRKQLVQKTFNTIFEGYECSPLRFFHNAAEALPDLFNFKGDEKVLDVAAGTGIPALVISAQLPNGSVTAIDFSSGMLSKARQKIEALKVNNIDLQQMDMTAMDLTENHFDAANSSFGIFFIEDMQSTLQHIVSKLKPGGTMVTTHFQQDAFSPLTDKFLERVEAYGIDLPSPSWRRVATEEDNIALFESAGLIEVEANSHDVGYFLRDAEEWWSVIWNAGYRGLIAGLEPERLAQFKREHLAEIEAFQTDDGIRLNIGVIHTKGIRGQ